MNPYDFVVAGGVREEKKKRPVGHDLFTGNSGIISCRMVTESPLFIAKGEGNSTFGVHKKLEFFTSEGKPTIPGSSFKGIIRSVAEAVADSCMVLCSGKYKHFRTKEDVLFNIPEKLKACTSIDHLCITCSMFGMMQKGEKGAQPKPKDQKTSLLKGKISFSDGKLCNSDFELLSWRILPELSSPKPQHRPFYESDHRVRGRKFYYHQTSPRLAASETNRNVSVQPIQNAVFGFEVSFQNLADEELGLLLYSLILEPGMRHKIGMGKPVGLGSVRIEILELKLDDPKKRYRSLEAGAEVYQDQKLTEFINANIRRFVESKEPQLEALRKIWQWPPVKEGLKYPGFEWFTENPGISLEDYNRQTIGKDSSEQGNVGRSETTESQRPRLQQSNYEARREAAAGRNFSDHKRQEERSNSDGSVRTFGEVNSMSQIRIIKSEERSKRK
jgi:CRISPR/Cas system CSM-associated protein Csm3 (group 7 of RAMP superfamily)